MKTLMPMEKFFSFCVTLAKRYRSFVATAYFGPFEKNESRFSEVIFSSEKEATFLTSGLFISFCTNQSAFIFLARFPLHFLALLKEQSQREHGRYFSSKDKQPLLLGKECTCLLRWTNFSASIAIAEVPSQRGARKGTPHEGDKDKSQSLASTAYALQKKLRSAQMRVAPKR